MAERDAGGDREANAGRRVLAESWRERPLTGGEHEIKVSRERCFPYSPSPSHL
jgi:hypothetical protein